MPDYYPAALAAAEAAIHDELKSSREVEPDRLAKVALEAAAPLLMEAWGVGQRGTQPGMEGLASLNAERTRQAGHRDADVARRALEILGDQCSQRTRKVAEARIASPEASWSEIAAKLGLNKNQAAGLFRRLIHRVPVYYALRDDAAYAAYYR